MLMVGSDVSQMSKNDLSFSTHGEFLLDRLLGAGSSL